MPTIHNKEFLRKLLIDNNVNHNNAIARGKFYAEYFDWEELSKLYQKGESIRNISFRTGLSYDVTRTNLLRKLGKLRDFSVKDKSNFYFKEELFYPILKNKGAYFLGWMYSDGCVTKNKLSIVLQSKDSKQVSYLANLVSNKNSKTLKSGCECFDFFSVRILEEFKNRFNLLPNKSHIDFVIPLERFSNETLPYLLLGLLEGDGSISKNTSCCSLLLSKSTWNKFYEYLKGIVNLSHIKVRDINQFGLQLIEFKGESYFSLLSFIYCNTGEVNHLKRKCDLFLKQVNRSMNGKTSPYKKLAVKLWDSLNCTTL